MGISPDNTTLAVVSQLTNSVSFVDVATNKIKGKVYVGRNAHEGFFTPDGKLFWLTVRGENYISIIDVAKLQEVRRVITAAGPGMVVFGPDGKVAFVTHSFIAELDVVDTKTYEVIKRIPTVSPLSPNLAVTFDGTQVWFTNKDVGKVSIVDAQTFEMLGVIESGTSTNHVNFAGAGGGTRFSGSAAGAFAYVTVGGENAVKVYNRSRQLVATIPTGPNPHGIWPSGDGSKLYVGLESGDGVDVISTATNTVIKNIPGGQAPQAIIYAVKAIPAGSSGMDNLEAYTPQAPLNFRLTPGGSAPVPGFGGGITLRSIERDRRIGVGNKKIRSVNHLHTLYI